ncbi:MAG: DUF1552 domain-containing protein [Gemmataceae bacterium]
MKPSRRTVLRSACSAVALPFLPSLGYARGGQDPATAARPKRLMFLGYGWGNAADDSYLPDRKQVGKDYKLTPGLEPLAKHKERFSVIQGLMHQHSVEGHWGSTFWLTGANRYGKPGSSFSNTISADQVAARQWGVNTRFGSLQLDCADAYGSGHGVGLSLAWDDQGKPIAGLENPLIAFHKLFSTEGASLDQRRAEIASGRSVLDALVDDAADVKRGISAADADKLDEYFQSVRDIETRLAREERWLAVPKPRLPDLKEPAKGLRGVDEIKMMYDLAVAAFRTDSTRVITYRQPVETLLRSMDIAVGSHAMTHPSPGPLFDAAHTRDRKQTELLAGLIDRLLAAKEPDGTSLFDHTTVVFGSNTRTVHSQDNCPTIVTGRGSGLKLGEHFNYPDKTPLCNLWLTILKGSDLKVEKFGGSTGTLDELRG